MEDDGGSGGSPWSTPQVIKQSVGDFYEFEEIVGEGNTSQVVMGVHTASGKQSAIKIIDKERMNDNPLLRERVDREIVLMKGCCHPHIVEFEGAYESDLEVAIVMELMRGGDLFERVITPSGTGCFSENSALRDMRALLHAVDYLHDRGIVHRDLKPENLLYTSKDEDGVLKVSDFGLSKFSNDTDGLETPCGTIAYTAPEVAHRRLYRRSIDMWSCGCILYFMLFGRPPFYSNDEEEIYDLVSESRWSFPPDHSHVSEAAKNIIQALLEPNPDRRLTAKQALAHPWIIGFVPVVHPVPAFGTLVISSRPPLGPLPPQAVS
eukprot:TRINITY_DN783_c0_g1_i5.p1 TRINITY_DN783_c0_g1~~TRINITY_DN783_c0_g1_i5.p1  ORF type:complete len:321 (-),score=65.85 TRINITY_DN783_c0_g1_i5:671-1633(-)